MTIGSKTLPTTFFVISGKGAYNLLLGRDRIHANGCISSTMHQCLIQWVGDKIEIVLGDSSYVIASEEADTYERTRCISGEIWEKDFLKVADYEIPPIQTVGSNEEFMDRFADDGKLGQGFTSADDLVEVDIGNGDRPRPTFISAKLDSECKQQLTNLLKEYKDCFAWDYTEMSGLDRSIIEHRLPIKSGFRPHQQLARRCNPNILSVFGNVGMPSGFPISFQFTRKMGSFESALISGILTRLHRWMAIQCQLPIC